MCLKVKDILFPFNIFGKKKQCVHFDATNVPDEGSPRRWHKTINIVWSGERMALSYTEFIGSETRTENKSIKNIYTDGDMSAITIQLPKYDGLVKRYVIDWMLFFNCTNVTYLEVNGERLI